MKYEVLSLVLVSAPLACGACGGSRADDGGAGASGPSPSSTATSPGPNPSCAPTAAADIAVANEDRNGYPPYAVSGCTLVYVAKSGALVARDLATGSETTIAPSDEAARRPTVSGDLVAWEASAAGVSTVRVRFGGTTRTVTGAFASAGEPRASGSSVVFTAWSGPLPTDDTDVWLYDAASASATRALGGAGQQRFADVSPAYVAATDFSEDPDGRYDDDGKDLADLLVLDRATGVVTKRVAPGKQAFPMLTTTDVVAYLDWSAIHPEPKLQGFQLRSGTITGDSSADRKIADVEYVSSDYARPAVSGTTIEWIANPDGVTVLFRAPADGAALPTKVPGLDGLVLHAPAPTASFTLLSAVNTAGGDATPRLRSVPR